VFREVVAGEAVKDVEGWASLVGKKFSAVVADDSTKKAEGLLAGALGEGSLPREVNLQLDGVEYPFRFSSIRVEDNQILFVGRDQRSISSLQQRMVSLQQASDREFSRLRQADTRYRLLFHVSSEAVLVAEVDGLRLVEANAAAATLLDVPAHELSRARAFEFFSGPSRTAIEGLIAGLVAGGKTSEVAVQLKGQATELMLSASLFRQAGTSMALLRLWNPRASNASAVTGQRLQAVIEAIPDGFVVVGEDRRILSANPAFCEQLQLANEQQVLGEPIDRWLGRPGVDINIMLANLREHGSIKNFSTILRSELGAQQEALVTAVTITRGKLPCTGFVIRSVTPRLFAAPSTLPRSVEQLRELVGRVSLKELVRESADLIERMCIEAALDVSGNNRASAAQLLGLSRQGLYSKLRRYGLGSDQS
jgi:transcriptional regulator PpsR